MRGTTPDPLPDGESEEVQQGGTPSCVIRFLDDEEVFEDFEIRGSPSEFRRRFREGDTGSKSSRSPSLETIEDREAPRDEVLDSSPSQAEWKAVKKSRVPKRGTDGLIPYSLQSRRRKPDRLGLDPP